MKEIDKTRPRLAKFLMERRMAAGKSQVETSKHLGYNSAQFVSNWERGISSPPVKTLRKLASYYNLDEDELFNEILKQKVAEATEHLSRNFYGVRRRRRAG